MSTCFDAAPPHAAPIALRRNVQDLVKHDRIHTSMYTDPALFEAEMETIFNNTWVWVAHESEVPEPGSYKNHWVGRQPVIVVRDRQDRIGFMALNRVSARLLELCRDTPAPGLQVLDGLAAELGMPVASVQPLAQQQLELWHTRDILLGTRSWEQG